MTSAETRLIIATARGVSILLRALKISTRQDRHIRREIRGAVRVVRLEREFLDECPAYNGGRCTCSEVP